MEKHLFGAENKEPISVIEEPDIREMLERRQIKSEDWPLVEELATMPKNLLIDNFHNWFNDSREKTAREIEIQLNNPEIYKMDDAKRRYWEVWLHFAKSYHWTACYNMVRVLERRNSEQ